MRTPILCASAAAKRGSTPRPFSRSAEHRGAQTAFAQPLSLATIRAALTPTTHSRPFLFLTALVAACFAAACTAAFGPGYSIEKQEIQVRFLADPQPAIHIDSVYYLRNDGNQPLSSIELRLPGRRRFHFVEPQADWNGRALSFETSPDNARNVILRFAEPWAVSSDRTLRLSVEFHPTAPGDHTFSFAPDAFFLPAEGWNPQLLPARGSFATGGVPPANWLLTLRVPETFLVHASGRKPKVSRHGGEQTLRIVQQAKDGYPFIIAGRYIAAQFNEAPENINLWTRTPQDATALRQPAASLITASHAYDAMFGTRSQESHHLWIVECPVVDNCFTSATSSYAQLITEPGAKPSAEMASLDTVMVDLSSGPPEIAAAAAPSLASSWLGYGQNPGFFEQDPPLSALPAFAATRGREAVQGAHVRADTIRRSLTGVPLQAVPGKSEEASVVRAKSLLFFFALQDRYGQDVFNKALSHMLFARRGGGFGLDDLIAAFEQESHRNVAEFVRHWMKRPGVPADFRARYETTTGVIASNPKETTP
jgi:hypothetical protein